MDQSPNRYLSRSCPQQYLQALEHRHASARSIKFTRTGLRSTYRNTA